MTRAALICLQELKGGQLEVKTLNSMNKSVLRQDCDLAATHRFAIIVNAIERECRLYQHCNRQQNRAPAVFVDAIKRVVSVCESIVFSSFRAKYK